MLKGCARESPEQALGHGNPQDRSRRSDGSLAALQTAEDDVESDLLVGDMPLTNGVDELAKEPRDGELDNAYMRLVLRIIWSNRGSTHVAR